MTTYVEYKFCERGFDSELRHGSPTGADAKHGISSVLLADAATDVDDTATQPSDAGGTWTNSPCRRTTAFFPVEILLAGSCHAVHWLGAKRGHITEWHWRLDALSPRLSASGEGHRLCCGKAGFSEAVGHGGVVAGAAVRRTQAAPVHSPDFCRPIRLSRLISAVWDSRGGDNDHMYINQA